MAALRRLKKQESGLAVSLAILCGLAGGAAAQELPFEDAGDSGAGEDPCADPMLAALAPPLRGSGFDRVQSACLASALSARARAAALIDDAAPGDSADVSAVLELRWLYLADLELTAGATAVERRYAEGGAGDGDAELGPIRLGAAAGRLTRAFGRPLRLAWALAVDVPWTDTGDGDGWTLAAMPQLSAALGLGRGLAGHLRAGALLGLARPPDDVDTRRALALSADLAWSPARLFAAGIGIEAQGGWHGSAVDHLLGRGGLRVALGRGVRLELTGAAPLAGREPVDLVAELGLIVGL